MLFLAANKLKATISSGLQNMTWRTDVERTNMEEHCSSTEFSSAAE